MLDSNSTGISAFTAAMAHDPEPMSVAQIAARLQLTREALDMSQADICRKTGITTQKWNNAETGDNRISIDDAAALCRATGVTLDWIYRGVRVTLPGVILEALARRENALARPPKKRA